MTPSEASRKKTNAALTCHLKWIAVLMVFLVASNTVRSQNPVAQFTSTTPNGCSPLNVQFTDQSTGNPVFWNWDLGNGQLSTVQNPVAIYTTPGTYTVTLVVRNGTGISSVTKTDYIVVNPAPTADFSANTNVACVPANVQFSDLSIPNAGTITQWNWDFGDGVTSNQQNPTHQYSNTGFYNVTLRVTSSTGCQAVVSKSSFIRVVSGVTPDFNISIPATCRPPFVASFANLTNGPGVLTYQWDFGNSTSSTALSPSATYTVSGNYTITLTATSEFGCSATVQKSLPINGTNTTFTAPDSVCLNETVFFQNTSPAPTSTSWDFGNGVRSLQTNDTTSYNVAGTYTIKMVNTYSNCTDSLIRSIVVRPNPTVDFTAANTIACRAPFNVSFQDLSPDAVSWNWTFGDGGSSTLQNPTHQYNNPGQYTVTLTITDSRGCRSTLSRSSFVRIVAPTVAISNAPAGGCVPFTFSPTAVVNAIDGIASYFWDFGDGNTSTSASPTNVYGAVGSYTIKLVITTNGGCRDSLVLVNGVRVGTPPTPNFSAAPLSACASTAVNFTDLSLNADAWLWNFGDGSTSQLQNPTHTYTDTGYVSVTLTAFNNGCALSITRSQYIQILPPVADFTKNFNCNNKRQVNFVNSSKTDAAYSPLTYLWEFGDPANSTSNIANPSFTYPSLGTYTVRLTVTNGTCSSTYTNTFTLNNDVADFTVNKTNLCKYEQFTVTAINSSPANIARYEWSFDGSPFTSLGPTTAGYFTTNGFHSIGLVVVDVNGCSDTLIRPTAVNISGPTASFTASNAGVCSNSLITFNDNSTPAGIVKWTWDYGDGQIQSYTNPPFNHTYTDTGMYTVTLKVEDASGCTDSYTIPQKIVITRPVAKFSASHPIICPSSAVQFLDSSVGYNLQYDWSFGDGNSSNLKNPTHVYNGPENVYTVKLVITDTVGCKDSVTKVNYISTKAPKPAFDIKDTSSICPLLETSFTFRGQDYESFYWDFGDGTPISNVPNPKHFYNTYGSYTATLYLVGYGGCTDSISSTINVYNPATAASIDYTPLNACNSLLVDFTITAPPSTYTTVFFGDGGIDTSQSRTFQHLFNTFGFFTPRLVLRDSLQCQVGIGNGNIIRIIGAEPLFGLDRKAFCDSGTVLFANYTIGNDPIVSSLWNFGDGNTSAATDPSYRYTTAGTFFPSLTVTTQAGCSKTLSDTVRVFATPNPIIVADSIVCINEQLVLRGDLLVADTATTWNWNLGNGSNAVTQNASTSYSRDGNYLVSLVATNKLGCSDTTTHAVRVPLPPVINIGGNPIIAVGGGVNLPVSYSPNIATYAWTPTQWLSCSNCPVPFAQPKSTTKYKIDVVDIYGCTNSNEVTVVVVCNDKNFFIPNTFSPNGDGKNDVFYPRGNGVTRIQSMRIFNRWGEQVFERKNFAANDPSMGWDGTYKGRKAESDAYVYIIELVCENSVIIPHRGNVTLIR